MRKLAKKLFPCFLALVLALSMTVSVFAEGSESYLEGYDLEEVKTVYSTGEKLAAQVVENGAVLLRNEEMADGDKALPLSGSEKVNVFGWAGSNNGFIVQGTGSGTGTRNNVVTFLGALSEAGISYNKTLSKKYSELEYERMPGGNYGTEASTDEEKYAQFYGVIEAPPEFLTEDLLSQAEGYSETAIVVIARLMGEGNDYSHYQYFQDGTVDKTRKHLALSPNEEYLIKTVRERFDKVIVVLNSANPMECGFAEDYDIDALVWMGYPGSNGATGLAKLLKGKANFSGKLTDIYAYDLATAASYTTSGREGVGTWTDANGTPSNGALFNFYSDYVEDIYVGYKWYETADAEGYWDNIDNQYGKGYDGVVQYPFGYGLSYTEFDWTVLDSSYKNGDTVDKDGTITVTLCVKNVGDFKGADVVEIYYTAPYTKGGIEKSAVNLGAFAKTAELDPGEVEIITLEMPVETMKSYDCYDRNNNGFMGYELEGGDYVISLRTDSHTLKQTTDGVNTITVKVPTNGYKYEVDSVTGNVVQNQFTNYTNNVSGASSTITNDTASNKQHSIDGNDEKVKITYLTRADFAGTFTSEISENREGGYILQRDTAQLYKFGKDDYSMEYPTWDSTATKLTVNNMMGVPFSDEKWDQITSQLSLSDAANLVAKGGFGTLKMSAIQMPNTSATDGPSGFNSGSCTNYPCSTLIAATWDWNIAYHVGLAIGEEGSSRGIFAIYGPGANLHRSPLGGRNFEYYSEDPLLSGMICAYHVLGMKTNGVTAYIKHLAVNDVERYRGGTYKWLTEQNLRETYLLPFEYAVKIGKSNAMMASVDRVGSVQASSNSALLIGVLREEWGFRGTVITDYYQSKNINDVDECIRAGCNLMLCPWGSDALYDDLISSPAQQALFAAAKEVIYTYVDTVNFKNTAEKLVKISLVGEEKEIEVVTTEESTEIVTEAPTEKVTEAPTEKVTEAPTEKVTETPTEAPTVENTEAPTEKVTEDETNKSSSGGCGSSIGIGGAAAVSAALAAAYIFKKKKMSK